MRVYLCLFFALSYNFLISQNTVGTISITDGVHKGYTLFSTHKKSFLINNCGQLIKEWTSSYIPGNSVYLLPNGNLLRTGKDESNTSFNFGGSGGIVEIFDWDGNLLWQYKYSTENYRQHHDVYPMPNGNVLILAATVMTNEEAVQAGRNPSITSGNLFNEQIIEVTPIGNSDANIVWEWNVKDHLIQDFDDEKDNFGVIADHSEKLDINFLNGGNGSANWLHCNSLQYNKELDQIILSSRNLSEFWIIDHSTTTEEAKLNTGGLYGKGGDFLYRWGNPQSYKQGDEDDRKLFGQHYPHYVSETGTENDGKIIVFNNGFGRDPVFSEVLIFSPPTTNTGVYSSTPNAAFGPESIDYSYSDSTSSPSSFFSAIVSSAQVLPNNNILICEGINGRFFELDENNNIVWEYTNPVSNDGEISTQFESSHTTNLTFRAIKYNLDYSAFEGKELSPGNPIENDFNLEPCQTLSTEYINLETLAFYPNPTKNVVNLNKQMDKIEVYTILGSKITNIYNSKEIDLSNYSSGVFLIKAFFEGKSITKRIIKTN